MNVYSLRSNEVVNGKAKEPTPDKLGYGEIAVNYADGYESLFIKNDSNDIIKMPFGSYGGNTGGTTVEVEELTEDDIKDILGI